METSIICVAQSSHERFIFINATNKDNPNCPCVVVDIAHNSTKAFDSIQKPLSFDSYEPFDVKDTSAIVDVATNNMGAELFFTNVVQPIAVGQYLSLEH